MKKIFYSKNIYWLLLGIYVFLLVLLFLFEYSHADSSIKNPFDVFWYSIVTMATVGYGDIVPVTWGGKIIGVFFVLASIGLMGFLIGNLTNKIMKYMEDKKYGQFGTEFEHHVVIIGWDKFGKQVTEQIIRSDKKVAIVTNSKEDIDLIHEMFDSENVFVFFMDYDNFNSLSKVNIEKSSSVFINFDGDMETLVYALNIKKKYPHVDFVVSVNNSDLKQTFINAGVNYVISKNEIASKLVASYIFEPEVAAFTEDLMSTAINEFDYDIQQYKVTSKNPYLNQKYNDVFIEMKNTYNCILVGISKYRDGLRQLLYNPSKSVKVEENDYLILISNGFAKKRIEQAFGVQEGKVSD